MRLRITILTVIVLGTRTLGLGESSAVPRVPRGLVSGQVIDASTGQRLGGAQVTLSSVSDEPALEPSNVPSRSVRATADGRYAFHDLGAGRYSISASKAE